MIPVKKQALAFSQKLNPSKGYNLKKKKQLVQTWDVLFIFGNNTVGAFFVR